MQNLRELLKEKNPKLINTLRKRTGWRIGDKKKGRENYAFATKFCHYACLYLLRGLQEEDNYSIYDEILGASLVAYAEEYGIFKNKKGDSYTQDDFKNYAIYGAVIDKIREKVAAQTGYLISRNGFDHLLWYYHKGHPIHKSEKNL